MLTSRNNRAFHMDGGAGPHRTGRGNRGPLKGTPLPDNGLTRPDKRIFLVVIWDVRIGGVLSLLKLEFRRNCLILSTRKSFQHNPNCQREKDKKTKLGKKDVILTVLNFTAVVFLKIFL